MCVYMYVLSYGTVWYILCYKLVCRSTHGDHLRLAVCGVVETESLNNLVVGRELVITRSATCRMQRPFRFHGRIFWKLLFSNTWGMECRRALLKLWSHSMADCDLMRGSFSGRGTRDLWFDPWCYVSFLFFFFFFFFFFFGFWILVMSSGLCWMPFLGFSAPNTFEPTAFGRESRLHEGSGGKGLGGEKETKSLSVRGVASLGLWYKWQSWKQWYISYQWYLQSLL